MRNTGATLDSAPTSRDFISDSDTNFATPERHHSGPRIEFLADVHATPLACARLMGGCVSTPEKDDAFDGIDRRTAEADKALTGKCLLASVTFKDL